MPADPAAETGWTAKRMGWWDRHVTRPRADQTARDTADLFDADPKGWRLDRARCCVDHSSGLGVWVGNEAYALRVYVDGDWQGERNYPQRLSGSASQRHIWRAFLRWRPAGVEGHRAKTALATARGRTGG